MMVSASLGNPAAANSADVDFSRDIRPILSDKCYACHGPDEASRKGELRLDQEAAALEAGVLIAGQPDESEVWARVSSNDPDTVMPPPDSELKLSDKEKEAIRRWIEQGAKFSAQWSFIPPHKSPLPAAPVGMQSDSPIDRFVWKQLADAEMQPSPEADRYTLIRRLWFDLVGLPPSSDDVRAFVADTAPDAYFGERMALDWLDAARYADTNGFSIDGGRHMWLWRDWVIQAFNDNKPYDEFLLEQIAGDLLPDATAAQRIATGFQRNNMVTHEGGTIPEENLTNYNADRVKTLGEAVLGLTLGCAQCHDHKYDPITQRDYYGLFAYFNTVSDVGLDGNWGVNPLPFMEAKTVLKTDEIPTLERRIETLKRRLAEPQVEAQTKWEAVQLRRLERRGKSLELLPVSLIKVSTPNRGSGFEIEEDRFVRVAQPTLLVAYDILAKLPPTTTPITGVRVTFHPDENAPGGGWGFGPKPRAAKKDDPPLEKGSFVLTALSASAGEVPADQVDLFRLLPILQVTANPWQADRRPEDVLDPRRHNGWAPELSHDGPVHITVTFDQPIDSQATPYLTTQVNFGASDNLIAAKMEVQAMTGVDDGFPLDGMVVSALRTPRGERSPEQAALLQTAFAQHAPQTRRLRTDLANAEERLAVLTQEFSTMVMDVAEKPRETFILNRGDYSQPTVKVSMSTPAALPSSSTEQQSRLDLARWLIRPDQPLTARVYVNRVWQMMFGAGIVRTPADFGAQGEWPTHPELLDWLAVDFVENGWNIKRLVKQIAMSETYRQSSATSPEMLQRDPQNRLLGRGPRFRIPAEFIRDAALKTSGLLQPFLGGPSVNPYTPGDPWREISHYPSTPATAQTFVQDHGEKLYRRSLYTFWKRTAPPPNMAAFDAPNRETCVVDRPTTNTPLQALVILNDVQFVEAARALAQTVLERDGDDRDRLRWTVLEVLSRPASDLELQVLSETLQRERERYETQPKEAVRLLAVGESPRNRNLSAVEHAAWTQVASVLLNLSESVTRN